MKTIAKYSLKSALNCVLARPKGLSIMLVFSTVLLSGCSYFQPYKAPLIQGNVMTQEAVASLQEGLNKNQVRELLGPPFAQHPFKPNHWEYIFYSANTEMHAHSEKHLIIQFDKDQMLTSWKIQENPITIQDDDSFLGLDFF